MSALSTVLKPVLLALPPAVSYCLLGRMYPELQIHLISFAAFFSVFLALPALGLGSALPLGERSWTESMFLGYPPAQTLLFLLIFAGARLGVPWLPAALPVLSIILLVIAKRREATRPSPTLPMSSLWFILAALVASLALCFTKFSYGSFPTATQLMSYYHDDVGTAAYVWSAVRSIENAIPYNMPFVAGFPNFPYHLIYHYIYGFATFAAHTPPMEQILFLWAPLHWTMLAGAVVIGCRRLAGLSTLETGLATLLLLFSEGYGFYASPSLQTLAYFHTFFFGLPGFLMLLATIYGYLSGRAEKVCAVHVACCYFVAAGTKANLLPFIPIALFPVFVYRLCKRTKLKTDLALAAWIIVAAGLLLVTHYIGVGNSQAQMKAFKPWSVFMASLGNMMEMAMVVGPFALVGLVAADRDVVLRHLLRRDRQFHIFLLTFCVTSAIFLKMVNYVGGDFYFYWQARFIAIIGFATLAAHALKWRTRIVAPLAALVMALSVGAFLYGKNFSLGTSNWAPVQESTKTIDMYEVEGLRWASRNLDRTSSFFTNKDHFIGGYMGGSVRIDMFDYPGFAGMQGYAWMAEFLSAQTRAVAAKRYVWLDKFWAAKTVQEREEALANIGANYYFHSERNAPMDFTDVRGMRKVYHNQSLTIYELTGGKDPS